LAIIPKPPGIILTAKKGLPENFLFYCVDGSGWYKIGNKKFTVSPNEFFMLPQNVEHAYGSSEKDPWSIYWVHFGGEMSASFNAMHAVKKHFHPCQIKSSNEIFKLFTKLYETLELGYSTSNLLFANMCLSHFLSLFIFNGKYFSVASSQKPDVIDNAILFMQEHIHENITLDELSKHYQYSPSRFSNLFKQKTGYAPIDYFSQMKMQRASQQLDFTDGSIKSIALSLGYDDPYYFSRKFRKIIGMSPSNYRDKKKH
jgi:AraC family transcriptional regulator, arabinose operon regulatory protein